MCILSIKRVTTMSNTNTDKQELKRKKDGVASLRELFKVKEGKDKKDTDKREAIEREKEKARVIKMYGDTGKLISLDEMRLLVNSGIDLKITATSMPHLNGWVAMVSWGSDRGEHHKMIRVSRGGAREFKSIDTLYSIAHEYCSDLLVSESIGYRKVFSLI